MYSTQQKAKKAVSLAALVAVAAERVRATRVAASEPSKRSTLPQRAQRAKSELGKRTRVVGE
jgi:hypothetical protein